MENKGIAKHILSIEDKKVKWYYLTDRGIDLYPLLYEMVIGVSVIWIQSSQFPRIGLKETKPLLLKRPSLLTKTNTRKKGKNF